MDALFTAVGEYKASVFARILWQRMGWGGGAVFALFSFSLQRFMDIHRRRAHAHTAAGPTVAATLAASALPTSVCFRFVIFL